MKGNVAFGCVFVALLWVFLAGPAGPVGRARAQSARDTQRAQGKYVLVLDSPTAPRPGLGAQLRIQLTGLSDVRVRHDLVAGDVATRIAAGSTLGQAEDVLLVVWSDGPITLPDGSEQAVLYAVGRQEGRALLEVVRVPGGQGPDMDRTLAIKVREVVSELQRSAQATPSFAQQLAAAVRDDGSAQASTSGSAQESPWNARVLLGAVLGPQPDSDSGQWGGQLGVGPSLALGAQRSVRVDALLGLAIFPVLTIHRAGARLQLLELAPQLSMHAQWLLGELWLGVSTAAALSFIEARGRTPLGAQRSVSTRLGSWLLGVHGELPLASGFALRLGIDLQTRLIAQRFAINAQPITELGRVRPLLQLGVSWRGH